jgi:hypothetical protein
VRHIDRSAFTLHMTHLKTDWCVVFRLRVIKLGSNQMPSSRLQQGCQ